MKPSEKLVIEKFNELAAKVIAIETLTVAIAINEKKQGDALKNAFSEARLLVETTLLYKEDSDAQLERVKVAHDKVARAVGWRS